MGDRKFRMFEKVEIPEGLKAVLEEQVRLFEALLAQVHDLALSKRKLNEEIWRDVHEVFPELKEYECTITNKGGEIALYPKYRKVSDSDLRSGANET